VCTDCHGPPARRYGGPHKAPELQKEAVYGITELHREDVRSARLVANPGCYPTSVQLPLVPLLQARPKFFPASVCCAPDPHTHRVRCSAAGTGLAWRRALRVPSAIPAHGAADTPTPARQHAS